MNHNFRVLIATPKSKRKEKAEISSVIRISCCLKIYHSCLAKSAKTNKLYFSEKYGSNFRQTQNLFSRNARTKLLVN